MRSLSIVDMCCSLKWTVLLLVTYTPSDQFGELYSVQKITPYCSNSATESSGSELTKTSVGQVFCVILYLAIIKTIVVLHCCT